MSYAFPAGMMNAPKMLPQRLEAAIFEAESISDLASLAMRPTLT
jgi:hypothetical protein